eukprot:819-Heterococcus_DN1.PRE.2
MLLVFVSELVLTEFLVVRHGVQICTSQAVHVPISGQPTTTHTLCQMNVEQLDIGSRSRGTSCALAAFKVAAPQFEYNLQLKLFKNLGPLLGGAQKFRNRFGSLLVVLTLRACLARP